MQKEQFLELLKQAVSTKQEGLKFSLEIDAKKVLEEGVLVLLEDFAKDSSNPYDDKLIEFVKPFLKQYLDKA